MQSDNHVKFVARVGHSSVSLTPAEMLFALPPRSIAEPTGHPTVLREHFLGANENACGVPGTALPGTTNYFATSDPKNWRTNVPNYASVRFRDIYPGIDAVYYGAEGRLEYDLELAAGRSPKKIRLTVPEGETIRLDGNGDLIISSPAGEIRQHRPVAFQRYHGAARNVAARYRLIGRKTVAFEIGPFDRGRALTIDPMLSYSTFLGNSSWATIRGLVLDSSNNAIVTGSASPGFPTTQGTIQPAGTGIYVAKINATGTQILWATYLGQGGSGNHIALDVAGNIYVTGLAQAGLPTTGSAFQQAPPGSNSAFFTKLGPNGDTLLYSVPILKV